MLRTAAASVLTATLLFAAFRAPAPDAEKPGGDPAMLLASAEAAFRVKNYNETVRLAQSILSVAPASPEAAKAERLVGLSRFGLQDWQAAYAALNDLASRRPETARDAAVVEALALSGLRSGALHGPQAADRLNAAIELYRAEDDVRKQLDLLFVLADFYRDMGHLRPGPDDWNKGRLDAVARTLETLDRALKAGGSIDDQLRALRGKVDVLVRYGPLPQPPGDAPPPDVATAYDLSRPFDLAIEFCNEIVRRWPDRPSAPEALEQIGDVQAQFMRDFVAAVSSYRDLTKRYPRSRAAAQAKTKILAIQSPQISLMIPDVGVPGEKVKVHWYARNVKAIEFSARPLDLFDVLRKIEDWRDLGKLRVDGAPVAAWTVATGDKGDHQPVQSGETPLDAPLTESNAYLLVAKGTNPDGKATEARAIALVSRLGVVAKTGRRKSVWFAMDSLTGEPLPQTELLVRRFVRRVRLPVLNTTRNEFAFHEIKVPDSGLAELALPGGDGRHGEHNLIAVARRGKDYAVTDAGFWGYWWGYADGFHVYSMTDRPVYRPGQTVSFKHLLRRYADGVYANVPNAAVKVSVRDSRGAAVYEKEHVSNENGSIAGDFLLSDDAALGMYSTTIESAGAALSLGPGGSFRVEEYKKPEFEVSVGADKPLYRLGDRMKIKIHAEYYFGGPVADAAVSYTIHRESRPKFSPWVRPYDWFYDEGSGGRIWWGERRRDLVLKGEARTDAAGDAFVEVETAPFPNASDDDVQYRVDVQVVDQSRREISASQVVNVSRRAFEISLQPRKSLYQPGDSVRVGVKSANANGAPVPFDGSLAVSFVEQREERDDSGKIKVEEVLAPLQTRPIQVGAAGEAEIEFQADKQGLYKVAVEAPDPFADDDGKIVGFVYVWVAKGPGEFAHYAHRDVELVLEKDVVQVGESIRMLLNCRHAGSYVLLAAEGDEIYRAEVIYVKGTQTTVEWPVQRAFQPNIAVRAHTFRDNKIFQDERFVNVPPVEQFLSVRIIAPKETFRPREEARIDVEVVDWQGKPAAGAEFSLGVMDASILYIQPETRGDVRKFFFGRQRPVSVRTTSSYAFRAWTSGGPGGWGGVQTAAMGLGGGMFARGEMDGLPAPTAAMAKAAPMEFAAEAPAADEAGAGEFASTTTRTDFRDTVFWAAHLVTDDAGKASATIRFPDSLTLWRMTAVAADPATRVGETTHEVRTKKNILLRLQTPRFLVEGDKFVLSAVAHNYFDQARRVRIDLTGCEGLSLVAADSTEWMELGRPVVFADKGAAVKDVEIPAGGEARVDFVFLAPRFGTAKVLGKVLSADESDAVELQIPVYEYGAEKLLADGGVLLGSDSSRSAGARLTIPADIRDESQTLTITMSPTIAGVMLESLPYLLEYPYGCTEQTMSRFLPAVLVSSTLRKLAVDLESLKDLPATDPVVRRRLESFRKAPVFDSKELERIVRAGVRRLADAQQTDGGWGWWKGSPSDAYLTAYVVSGLALAAESGAKLPDRMLERGVERLAELAGRAEPVQDRPWQRGENASLRAYLLYALGQADAGRLRDPLVAQSLRRVFENRDDLTDYGRAVAALALADAGMREEAQLVLSNIKDRARVDEQTNTASWGEAAGFLYWYDGGTEATSYSLKALVRLDPASPLIPKTVQWLVRRRQGTRWFNTKDTAVACCALVDYLTMSGELDPDLTLIAELDGRELRRVHVTRRNLFAFDGRVEVAGRELGVGPKDVVVRAEGRGSLYWGAYASFFTKEAKITAGGNEIFVERAYQKLVPKEVSKTRKVVDPATGEAVEESYTALEFERTVLKEGDRLESGDLVEVVLSIDARNNFEYLVFEDPKPAGCEPTELRSGWTWEGGFGAFAELRDERTAFFAPYMNQGKHRIAYRLRAEIPGEFRALPARGECMYTPFVKGNGESWTLRIHDKPR